MKPVNSNRRAHAENTMPLFLQLFTTWFVLLLLWVLFVFQFTEKELLLGAVASAITAILVLITLRVVPLRFQPRLRWLLQAGRLPAIIAQDTWILMKDFGRRLLGKRKRSGFELVKFAANGEGPLACAQRALATLYVTMSPNSVVLDVDKESGDIFLHYLSSKAAPAILRKLER